MNLESIKTYILVVLVAISIILTIRIWNFAPDLDQESIDNQKESRQISIEGKQVLVKDVVLPSGIIFHKENGPFALQVQDSEQTLYKEMQQWTIQQFGPVSNVSDANGVTNPAVQVNYPVELPLQIINQLFKLNDKEYDSLPQFNFDRIYFLPDLETKSAVEVIFASSHHNQRISANIFVQQINPYESLMAYLENDEALTPLMPLTVKNEKVIYLPVERPVVDYQTFNKPEEISDEPLINNLFQDPSAARKFDYYTDGRRKLEMHYNYSNLKYMEYDNAISREVQSAVSRLEVINKTQEFINNHNGWTNDFMLMDINDANTWTRYHLMINGYPILVPLGLMELEWNNDDLYQYNRPLIRLSDPFPLNYGEQSEELPNGQELINYFNSDYFRSNVDQIEDIQIGYSISDEDDNFDVLILEPNWFIKISGEWKVVDMENSPGQGGL